MPNATSASRKKRKVSSDRAADEAFEKACQSFSQRREQLLPTDEYSTYGNFFASRLREMAPALKKKCLEIMMQVVVNPEEIIQR